MQGSPHSSQADPDWTCSILGLEVRRFRVEVKLKLNLRIGEVRFASWTAMAVPGE